MIDEKPRIYLGDIIAGLLVYLGFLLFLIALHILAIESTGNVHTVLTSTFTVFVALYSALCVAGIVAVIIQMFLWLSWQINTPTWKKKKSNGGNLGP